MSPEERMRASDAVLVQLHEDSVARLKATTADRTLLEQTRLIAAVALTARRLHGVLGAGDRRKAAQVHAQLRADAAAIAVSTAEARARQALAARPAANENVADANLEMEMDDDSGRTPERMAQLHAEISSRMEAVRNARESKQLARQRAAAADRAVLDGAQAEGGAPGSPG